ncbi:MAG TPA: phosphoadenylyl-sulfate reductase [Solibacterales bacterium]|nr:phosphoadenylyl-sulfate reductase [Bryobacterales bacterium]
MPDLLAEAQAAIGRILATAQPGEACVTSSFQAEDMVVVHLVRALEPAIPVLFLETGYHFAETYAYRDQLARDWNLNLVNLLPSPSAPEHLYRTDPAGCCQARKVEPLMRGLDPFEYWFTGLRREQSPTRANLQVEETHRWPTGKTIRKVSPLAAWTMQDVWAYVAANEIPSLPLYQQGYLSIGCEPCTQKPADPGNPRSGRWGGHKLECGIHTFTNPVEAR